MDLYRATAWLHIVLGIVLAGQALFWVVMLAALRQRFGATGALPLLQDAKGARWPHVGVPERFRVPLPVVAWLTLMALAATGVLLIGFTGERAGLFWSLKLGLFGGVLVSQAVITIRPVAPAIIANFVLTLALMIVSGWMVRG